MSWFLAAVGRFPRWGWVLSACLLVLGLFLARGGYRLLVPTVDRGFQNAEFDIRVEKARTQAEFEALLGPPGDYSTRDRNYIGFHSGPPPTGRLVTWKDDYAVVVVYFDREGDKNYWGVYKLIPDNRDWRRRLWGFLFDD